MFAIYNILCKFATKNFLTNIKNERINYNNKKNERKENLHATHVRNCRGEG